MSEMFRAPIAEIFAPKNSNIRQIKTSSYLHIGIIIVLFNSEIETKRIVRLYKY